MSGHRQSGTAADIACCSQVTHAPSLQHVHDRYASHASLIASVRCIIALQMYSNRLRESVFGQHATVAINHYKLCRAVSELGSCVNVEVAVLGSPSLIVPTVSVDVKQH